MPHFWTATPTRRTFRAPFTKGGPNGAAAWLSGNGNDALRFYVNGGQSLPYAMQPSNGTFSVSIWLNTSKSFLGLGGPILFMYNGAGGSGAGNSEIFIGSLHSSSSSAVTGMQFYVRDSLANPISVNTYETVNDGNWHNFVLVRDSQTTIQCYVDGNLAGAGTNASLAAIYGNSPNAYPGIFNNYNVSGGASWYGMLFNIDWWNRGLSAQEARLLYENGRLGQ
jgi:hypothetical protein